MSERIVLVVDGGPASDAALAWTLARAKTVVLDVRLTTIDESGSSGAQPERRLDDARALGRDAAQFAEQSPRSNVEMVMLRGGSVDRLARESERADIVVLGSHSVGLLARVFNATVPLALAPRSSCPVVIVPADWVPSSGPVVVGVDQPTSITAHEFAAREAERLDRALVLVRAWELPPFVTTALLGAGAVDDAIREANAELLATAASGIERRHGSLSVIGKLSYATPSRALAAGAESMELVVIGTHHRHTLAEWMLGSVGHDLVMHLPCPVAIVPPVDGSDASFTASACPYRLRKVTMDTLFAVLHVVTAVFIVGPMAILPMTAMRAARAGNGAQVMSLAKATSTFSLLSLVVFVLGFAVLGMSDPKDNYSFSSAWIIWSMILYVVALAVNLFVTVPAMKRASGSVSASTDTARPAGYGAIAGGSGLASLLLVAVVVLMVWKP